MAGGESGRETEICIICSREKEEGIRIVSEWICEDCETEIVKTEVEDEKYPFFIYQLRKLWTGEHALGRGIRQTQMTNEQ